MILLKADAILASNISKFEQLIAMILIPPMNRPSLLLWYITKVVTWFLNLIFQHDNDDGVGNVSNWSSDIWWIEHGTWIAKNVSLCPRHIPCIKWHASVAAQHRSRTWNDCCLTGNVRKISTVIRFYILKFSWIVHAIHPILQLLHLWSELLCHDSLSIFVLRIRQLSIPELSSILSFHEYIWSECLEALSLSWPLLPAVELALFEILHIRNGLQFQPLWKSLPLKFANASVKSLQFPFLLHEFRSRFSKHVISITIKKRFRSIYRIRESEERFVAPKKTVDVIRENLLHRKMFLDSNYLCLKTKRQVSLYLSDAEMNWTSSFLV